VRNAPDDPAHARSEISGLLHANSMGRLVPLTDIEPEERPKTSVIFRHVPCKRQIEHGAINHSIKHRQSDSILTLNQFSNA